MRLVNTRAIVCIITFFLALRVALFMSHRFGVPVLQFEDPSSDEAVLADWVYEAAKKQDENASLDAIPLRIKSICRSNEDFHAFVPVVMKSLAQLNTVKVPHDVGGVFRWILASLERNNQLFALLKLDPSDIDTVRGFEFAIYRRRLDSIWPNFVNESFQRANADYFEISRQIGLEDNINRLLFQIGQFKIQNWLSNNMHSSLSETTDWVTGVLCRELRDLVYQNEYDIFLRSMMDVMYKEVSKKHKHQLLELVHQYPQSELALQDLNQCLKECPLVSKHELVSHFINQLESKILIPSISTKQIMSFYIKTIKSLLIVDHRGIMLDRVARPIREYLFHRPDTITNTVIALMDPDEKTNELIDINRELMRVIPLESNNGKTFEDFLKWTPEPLEALPDFRVGKIDDVIDSFVSIFNNDNNKQKFIDELIKMFSLKLLQLNLDLNEIKTNLALIKRKFQSSDNFNGNEFTNIDIMIHDIELSKRIDYNIHAKFPMDEQENYHAVFLSHLYWPSLSQPTEQKIIDKLPEDMKKSLEGYRKNYIRFQPDRELKFHAEQSVIKCNIEIRGEEIAVDAKVLDLCVINWFIENTKMEDHTWKSVKIGILVVKLGMSLMSVKNSLAFWKQNGVLIETNGNWKIAE